MDGGSLDGIRAFIINNPILAASLSSLWGAVVVDLLAFAKTKEPGPFLQTFNIKIALLRYIQSFVGGFVGNAVVVGAASTVTGLVIWLW